MKPLRAYEKAARDVSKAINANQSAEQLHEEIKELRTRLVKAEAESRYHQEMFVKVFIDFMKLKRERRAQCR